MGGSSPVYVQLLGRFLSPTLVTLPLLVGRFVVPVQWSCGGRSQLQRAWCLSGSDGQSHRGLCVLGQRPSEADQRAMCPADAFTVTCVHKQMGCCVLYQPELFPGAFILHMLPLPCRHHTGSMQMAFCFVRSALSAAGVCTGSVGHRRQRRTAHRNLIRYVPWCCERGVCAWRLG